MQENPFSNFVDYFKALQLDHLQLKDFIHGTTSRIIGKSRSDLNYPCLWLETPSFKPRDNGAGEFSTGQYGAFVVMRNANLEPEEEDQVWAETLMITFDVLSRLKMDSENEDFKLRIDFNSISVDPISTLTTDNDFGWRVEFALEKELDLCYDPTKWK